MCRVSGAATTPARWFGGFDRGVGLLGVMGWGLCAGMVRQPIPGEAGAAPGVWPSVYALVVLVAGALAALVLFVDVWRKGLTQWPPYRAHAAGLAAVFLMAGAVYAAVPMASWRPSTVLKAVLVVAVAGGPCISVLRIQFGWWPDRRERGVLLLVALTGLWGFLSLWLVAHWRAAPRYANVDGWTLVGYDLLLAIVAAVVFVLATVAALHATPRARCKWEGIEDIVGDEHDVIRRRRQHASLAPGADGTAPPGLVGLALSGGGIRSATVSLGFLRELCRSDGGRSLFERIDYLSTVSGGGWAGGALTARYAARGDGKGPECDGAPDFAPSDDEGWRALADHLRRRGDYLVPGGLGFTSGTLKPIIALVWGGVVNSAAFVVLAASVCALAFNMSHPGRGSQLTGPVWMLKRLETVEALRPLYIDANVMPCLVARMYVLNVVPLLLSLVALVMAVLLGVILVGYFRGERLSHGAPLRWVSGVAVLFIALGTMTLALRGSVYLTMIAAGIAVIVVARLMGRRLSLAQLAVSLVGIVVTQRLAAINDAVARTMTDVTAWWAAGLERALVWPGAITMELIGGEGIEASDDHRLWAGALCLVFFCLGFFVNRNRTSLHVFWRRQIRNAYLGGLIREPADVPIHELEWTLWPDTAPAPRWCGTAPLQIMNAAVNTPGSANATLAKRGTARFELSPLFIGGAATGWVPSTHYAAHRVSLSTAVAVSAAAVNSQGGTAIPRAARMVLAALNLGLGYWLPNPRVMVDGDVRGRVQPHFWTAHLLREMVGMNSESSSMLFVSDGGHHDNLGLSALVERGCELVIAVDAAADDDYDFFDLANVVRVLRIDGGWELKDFDLGPLRAPQRDTPDAPAAYEARVRACPVVTGRFERCAGGKLQRVAFVYIKACVVPDLPLDTEAYARRHPAFPQQTTADQFFDEAQFEAYFTLGSALARHTRAALADPALSAILDAQCGATDARRGDP